MATPVFVMQLHIHFVILSHRNQGLYVAGNLESLTTYYAYHDYTLKMIMFLSSMPKTAPTSLVANVRYQL